MKITYDTRIPTVVIVGYWNVAILNQPAWIAHHILGIAENTEVEVRNILIGDGQSITKKIWVFEKFALSCQDNRLEIFHTASGSVSDIHALLARLAILLPHTPVSAIGFNFHYSAEGEITPLVGRLNTNDILDNIGAIVSSQRTEVIDVDRRDQLTTQDNEIGSGRLKLDRVTDFSKFEVDFNFHHDLAKISGLTRIAELEAISHWQTIALKILEDSYDLADPVKVSL